MYVCLWDKKKLCTNFVINFEYISDCVKIAPHTVYIYKVFTLSFFLFSGYIYVDTCCGVSTEFHKSKKIF